MAMVKIQYVGKKPFCADNVAGSKQFWTGHGDVREVTEAEAKRLCEYPDQWRVQGSEVRESGIRDQASGVQESEVRNQGSGVVADTLPPQSNIQQSAPAEVTPTPATIAKLSSSKLKNLSKQALVDYAKSYYHIDLELTQTRAQLLAAVKALRE